MSRSDFVHLHVHSDYSLLDATCRLEPLLERTRELGMHALALTDHGNLFGAVEFYEKAIKAGVKPILGCELYLAAGGMGDPDAKSLGRKHFHLTVLARNEEGYRNLLTLASAAYLQGFHGKPRVDKALLQRHAAGLLALSGCLSGEIPQFLRQGDVQGAEAAAGWYRDVFGKDGFYLEVMDHGTELQRQVNRGLLALSAGTGIPLVATNDVHYVRQEDARAHDAFICIGSGRLLSEVDRRRYPSETFHLRSPAEMQELFKELPQALAATREVAERCHLELPLGQWHLPAFQSGQPVPNAQFLKALCLKGLQERYGKVTPALQERLDYELGVIERMGFTNYFLIVWDFIRFAREKGIPVGPGRGSAASSIVAYCLRITAVDPLRYELVFERFLEPSRITQPDIDIDFCVQRREEVLDYVRGKYGPKNVAQIITFGTMAARAVIRDVGRVLDIPLHEIDILAKRIPAGPDQTLAKATQADPELKAAFESDARTRDLLEISHRLEGLCRHASTHAAGVVIADRELSAYVPLYQGDRGVLTQYSMEVLERIGLLKMDFLGLETLTLLARCVALVREKTGELIDLEALPLDDPQAFAVLSRGETMGVFQCESSGMRELMMRLKPGRIDEVIAAIALYRPGPLQSGMVDAFIRRKNGQEEANTLHPSIEGVLKPTYGVIVYQEQVMQIANRLAGFTMAEADTLRKAMGKKNPEIVQRLRERFIEGSVKRKVPQAVAEQIFEQIAFFAGYGFNKAHSTAYAIICYQTAWLKAKHPTEFMAAALTSVMGKTEKVVAYLDECRRMEIEVLPPSVNESALSFAVAAPRRIRFGLGAVRNVGDKAVESILAARGGGGPFTSLQDFCERADLHLVNLGVVEHLIKAGALDFLKARRSQLVAVLEHTLEMAQTSQQDRRRGQGTFFGSFGGDLAQGAAEAFPDVPEWPEGQRLAHEKESLGFYVSSHPLARYAEALKRFSSAGTGGLGAMADNQEVILGGILTKVKRTTAKKGKAEGERMAILSFEDLEGTCEAVVFPGTYAAVGHLLAPDRILFLQGRLDKRRDEPSLKVNAVVPIEKVYETFANAVTVSPSPGADEGWFLNLRNLLREHPGECPVYLEFEDRPATERLLVVGNDLFVTPSAKLLEGLHALAGAARVRLSSRRRIQESSRPAEGKAAKNAIPF